MSNFQSISLEALSTINGGQTTPAGQRRQTAATRAGTTSTGANVQGPVDQPPAPRRNHIDLGAYAETQNNRIGVTAGYRRDLTDHSYLTINGQLGQRNGQPDHSIRAGYHIDF